MRFIDGNRNDRLSPTDFYTWDTRLERVPSQTVSCCFYRAPSQVREKTSLTLDDMEEALTLLMKQSSPMLMFVHEHLSPPRVVFSLIHHQFGPELSVSLRGKDGRDILTKFSHLPEFDVYQASCQLSKNVWSLYRADTRTQTDISQLESLHPPVTRRLVPQPLHLDGEELVQ